MDDQAADVGPLWTLELDVSVGAGTGTHRIEILDGSDAVLFTRNFTPGEVEVPGDATPTMTFSEFVPVQAGAARLRIVSDTDAVLADFPLNGDSTAVDSITLPSSFSGVQPLTWSVSDPDGGGHTYWVDYSPDGEETWVNLAMNLEDAGLAVDFDTLAASDGQGVFRVVATDGVNSGELVSAAFTVGKKAPHAEIIGPTETSFHSGSLVMLEAAAWDVDDGAQDGTGVTWSSDLDGPLGSGANLPVYDLTVGAHTVTVTAQDSDGNTATDSVTITVSNAPIVEGGVSIVWGNTDCSADGVKSRDAQAVGKFVLQGTSLVPTEPCPDVGQSVTIDGVIRVWGNWDCSLDGIRSRDAQASGKLVLQGTPLTQTQPCPAVGASVNLSG